MATECQHTVVVPVYVAVGFAWESTERRWLESLLAHPAYADSVDDVVDLHVGMEDVYAPSHWARSGRPPAYDTPDEDVYIFGRNVVLLSKTAVYCAHRGIERVALGPLAGNPFPDATPDFFDTFGRGLSIGLGCRIEIAAPFRNMHKDEVIRLGESLGVPFELTLSCMNPSDDRHCGACSKCRERREAFRDASVSDPTRYRGLERDTTGSRPS